MRSVLAVLHHQDQGELVPAEAADSVADPDAGDETVTELLQQFVADRVSEGVVHGLEVIEVDEQDRDIPITDRRLGQRLAQGLVEERAIGQTR